MPDATPHYIERVPVNPAGTVDRASLPVALPYGLTPRDFFRTVEDVHDLLHDLNSLLHGRHYQRLEELLDPAGFSGLISRTVVTRLAQASHSLVVNRHHNGYPDLVVRGRYPHDAVQHGEGGLEVKASRYESGWQAHGPRSGWFVVVQFALDEREDMAAYDLEPTRVRAVLTAEVSAADWSWQPAKEGSIRSGTASIKHSGLAKLRAGAVWVDPMYREKHDRLASEARINAFSDAAIVLIVGELRRLQAPASARMLAEALAPTHDVPVDVAERRLAFRIQQLQKAGRIRRAAQRGFYELT